MLSQSAADASFALFGAIIDWQRVPLLKCELRRLFLVTKILYNKQNNTWLLGDMQFLFSGSNRYLTRFLRSRVRYRIERSKRNSISPRAHVLFSIYMLSPLCAMNYNLKQRISKSNWYEN